MEAAEAVVPAVVLNTKDSGTFHGRGRKKGVTKSSPEKNIESSSLASMSFTKKAKYFVNKAQNTLLAFT